MKAIIEVTTWNQITTLQLFDSKKEAQKYLKSKVQDIFDKNNNVQISLNFSKNYASFDIFHAIIRKAEKKDFELLKDKNFYRNSMNQKPNNPF